MRLLYDEPGNPFRPGGELSKEAAGIVDAIQSGKLLDQSYEDSTAADTSEKELENLVTNSDCDVLSGKDVEVKTVTTTTKTICQVQNRGNYCYQDGGR